MRDSSKQIAKIREFINEYMKQSKQRGKMYGGLEALETQWDALDNIYFILEDLYDTKHELAWGWFLHTKGYGARNADQVIKELKPSDPYLELVNLRNEYEQWRKKEIRRIRNRRSKVNNKEGSPKGRSSKC